MNVTTALFIVVVVLIITIAYKKIDLHLKYGTIDVTMNGSREQDDSLIEDEKGSANKSLENKQTESNQ